MTYSLIARCPRTGQFGIAISTYTLAVGQYCDGLVSHRGITMSQASVRQANNALGVQCLEQGFEAPSVLDVLLRNDSFSSFRQIAVVDRFGQAVCHTGDDARDWKGHRVGPGVVAMGNVLLGPRVVDDMLTAFNALPESGLADRLIAALESGRDAGGQSNGQRRMPERSAALIVIGNELHPDLNLRVDLHDRAVNELRRLYTRYQPYLDYYRLRDLTPHAAPSQEVFEESFGGQTYWAP
jgi:uncharacterized Ntn-hydrolase superfamily protein